MTRLDRIDSSLALLEKHPHQTGRLDRSTVYKFTCAPALPRAVLSRRFERELETAVRVAKWFVSQGRTSEAEVYLNSRIGLLEQEETAR